MISPRVVAGSRVPFRCLFLNVSQRTIVIQREADWLRLLHVSFHSNCHGSRVYLVHTSRVLEKSACRSSETMAIDFLPSQLRHLDTTLFYPSSARPPCASYTLSAANPLSSYSRTAIDEDIIRRPNTRKSFFGTSALSSPWTGHFFPSSSYSPAPFHNTFQSPILKSRRSSALVIPLSII